MNMVEIIHIVTDLWLIILLLVDMAGRRKTRESKER